MGKILESSPAPDLIGAGGPAGAPLRECPAAALFTIRCKFQNSTKYLIMSDAD